MLPDSVAGELQQHVERARRLHARDLRGAWDGVPVPDALATKFPNAPRDWRWYWVLPAGRLTRMRDGRLMRYHVHETVIQRAVHAAEQRELVVRTPAGHQHAERMQRADRDHEQDADEVDTMKG